jgi:hypothetical protein
LVLASLIYKPHDDVTQVIMNDARTWQPNAFFVIEAGAVGID